MTAIRSKKRAGALEGRSRGLRSWNYGEESSMKAVFHSGDGISDACRQAKIRIGHFELRGWWCGTAMQKESCRRLTIKPRHFLIKGHEAELPGPELLPG